jgi:hypothetical protein
MLPFNSSKRVLMVYLVIIRKEEAVAGIMSVVIIEAGVEAETERIVAATIGVRVIYLTGQAVVKEVTTTAMIDEVVMTIEGMEIVHIAMTRIIIDVDKIEYYIIVCIVVHLVDKRI